MEQLAGWLPPTEANTRSLGAAFGGLIFGFGLAMLLAAGCNSGPSCQPMPGSFWEVEGAGTVFILDDDFRKWHDDEPQVKYKLTDYSNTYTVSINEFCNNSTLSSRKPKPKERSRP